MKVYHDYMATFDDFQALGAQDRASIYTVELHVMSEPLTWINRLESSGFVQVGVDTLYLPVASVHDFPMSLSNRLKDILGTQAFQLQAFQMGPDACSSPRHSREHLPPARPEPPRTVTHSAPTVSFAVSTASTPTTASISAPNIMSSGIVRAPGALQSTVAQPFPSGARDRVPAAGRGPGHVFSQSMEDVSEIRRPFINVD